jgi:hypothetical protein
MAGRRKQRQTRQVLVASHDARAAALRERLILAAASPADQIAVASDYLRGAVARTGRDVPAEASATARHAVQELTDLGDQLFRTAIEKRRTRS